MRKRCLINCGFWIYNWNKLCVAPVSLKEKMLKWSSSFHGRLPSFLLTVADSTVNWGLWWLMGRISPSNCGISEFWKHKNLAAFQTQVEGNWPERVPQMWTNLGKFFFFILLSTLLTIHIDLCGIYAKWNGWPVPRTTSRGKANIIFNFLYCPNHYGADRETIWKMWEAPTFESLSSTAQEVRLHRLLWSTEQQSQEQVHVLYLPWQSMYGHDQSYTFISLWPL